MEAEAGMAAATETQVRPAPRSRTLRDRIRRATGWLLAAPKDDKHGADPEPLRKLRGRLALALVVLAILSAFALWRASVHEELASQSDVHFRQELVLLQQLDRTTVDAIFEELAVFGSFQEHRVLHDRFAAEAQQTRDPALARRLRQEARSEQRLADVQLPAFQEQGLKFDGVDARYDAAAAYRGAVTYDTERAALQPAEHRHEATAERSAGVWLTLVAALFIAALLCMTLAEVSLAPRSKDGPPPGTGAAKVLAGSGLVIALVAAAFFAIVNW